MKMAILSNVNIDLLVQSFSNEHELFQTDGYGQWISYALSKNKDLSEFDPRIIFLLIDGNALLETCKSFEEGITEIRQSFSYIKALASNYSESIIAVSTINVRKKRISVGNETGYEAEWEAAWNTEMRGLKNIVAFDLCSIIENAGAEKFYSEKMWYMGSIPYSMKGFDLIKATMLELAENISRVRKKVLILDLDNTLWGGVCGEDGAEGITLSESLIGAAYRDAQKRIKEIGQTGILLAIVSKNNPEDVDAVFEKNPHMVLKKDDFVSVICNWEQKFVNIANLAKTLNLGLDSFVFLDDNPVEREAVRINLPEVTVPDFPKDIAKLPDTVIDVFNSYFWCKELTAEDRVKTEQYKQEALRKQDMESAASIEDYLKSLNIVIKFGEVRQEQKARTVQLLNKTNQFNTNTVRLDEQEFAEFLNNGKVFVAVVTDKYGDNGLVAELLIHIEGNVAVIDNFLMSCRVMGRQIEDAIIAAFENKMAESGIACVRSSYIPSAKNKPVEQLWDRLGYKNLGSGNYEKQISGDSKSLLKVEWQ